MAARHFLHLAHGPLPGAHVVVEHVLGRGHRRVREAQRIGLELVAGDEPEAVCLLLERDRVLLAAFEVTHHDPRQGVLAFEPDEPAREDREAGDQYAGTVGDEIGPSARGLETRAAPRRF